MRGSCTASTRHLRRTTQLVGTVPADSGVTRLNANHLSLAIFASAPEVRVLPSPGVTRLHRYYGPVRLPPQPPPKVGVEVATPAATGLPRCTGSPSQRAVPNTPADRTGAGVDLFPVRAAFPVKRAGRHPRIHFRGLLRLSLALRPAGLLDRPRRPLSRGFDPASCPTEPLVSYQTYRQLSGWILPPLVIRAFSGHT